MCEGAPGRPWCLESALPCVHSFGPQFVLNVVQPQSTGIGGGCMFLVFNASSNTTIAMDGREVGRHFGRVLVGPHPLPNRCAMEPDGGAALPTRVALPRGVPRAGVRQEAPASYTPDAFCDTPACASGRGAPAYTRAHTWRACPPVPLSCVGCGFSPRQRCHSRPTGSAVGTPSGCPALLRLWTGPCASLARSPLPGRCSPPSTSPGLGSQCGW
jgi:hypothetical protein